MPLNYDSNKKYFFIPVINNDVIYNNNNNKYKLIHQNTMHSKRGLIAAVERERESKY